MEPKKKAHRVKRESNGHFRHAKQNVSIIFVAGTLIPRFVQRPIRPPNDGWGVGSVGVPVLVVARASMAEPRQYKRF
jgi:hypothetical protein